MTQVMLGWGRGYPDQGYQDWGYPDWGYPDGGYPDQAYPDRGYPDLGYPGLEVSTKGRLALLLKHQMVPSRSL